MNLIHPGDARYDDARTVFNAMVDKRPAVIAECASPTDVVHALALARELGYDVAVRAGGHSVAGLSMNDGGLVVDVRPMKDIEVDPKRRWARVGAGVTWGEFDRAAQAHGLATTGGRMSTTGVAGFTLAAAPDGSSAPTAWRATTWRPSSSSRQTGDGFGRHLAAGV